MTMPGVEAAVAHAVAVGAEVWVPLERVTDEDATREDVSASYARGVVKRVDESADAIDVEDGLGRRMRAKASAALLRDAVTQEDMVKLNHLQAWACWITCDDDTRWTIYTRTRDRF